MQLDLFHRNIPGRLEHLRDLPFAHYVGTTAAGVDWVAYEPRNVERMTRNFRLMILKSRLTKAAWK